jgi:hypothetical protein
MMEALEKTLKQLISFFTILSMLTQAQLGVTRCLWLYQTTNEETQRQAGSLLVAGRGEGFRLEFGRAEQGFRVGVVVGHPRSGKDMSQGILELGLPSLVGP